MAKKRPINPYPVPQNKKKGCLCRDGSYSRKCCNKDDYFAQGFGPVDES